MRIDLTHGPLLVAVLKDSFVGRHSALGLRVFVRTRTSQAVGVVERRRFARTSCFDGGEESCASRAEVESPIVQFEGG
jgi:hypothetical protein